MEKWLKLLPIIIAIIVGGSFVGYYMLYHGAGISGKYVVTVESHPPSTWSNYGTVFEFRPDGKVYISLPERVGGGGVLGEYEIEGNRIIITVEMFGTKILLKGEIGNNIISTDEGLLLEKEGFKLEPELTGKYVCIEGSASWGLPKGTIFDFKPNREVHIIYDGKTVTGEYMAYKNRITVVTQDYILSGEIRKNVINLYVRKITEPYLAVFYANITLAPVSEGSEEKTPPTNTILVKRETYGDGSIESLDLESEYLPVVVACEIGGVVSQLDEKAAMEVLKAQAVVSRTFAIYKRDVERKGWNFHLYDDERDQVYNPNHPNVHNSKVMQLVRKAIEETKGMILRYKGKTISAFFVTGNGGTAEYVTINEGKSGEDVERAKLPIGNVSNPANRGCMGQIQAIQLAKKGYTWQRILRYFYGEDIEIAQIKS